MLKFKWLLIIGIMLMPFTAHAQTASTDAVMTVTGEPEIVFDWTTDRCADLDIPDVVTRAFRDADGQIQLLDSHWDTWRSIGPSLDELTRDCEIVAYSVYDADPAMYSDREWIASVYTEDGSTIYALQHNEYQGHNHAGQCASGDYLMCWYNSLTLAVSTDGGASYSNVTTPPDHLVASLPQPYVPDTGPAGIMTPSNMIRGEDGFVYAFVKVDLMASERQFTCLMRTDNLADPASWRAWDGRGFNFQFANPYTDEIESPTLHMCTPIAEREIGALHENVTYNTYLDKYVLIGASEDTVAGERVFGVYYSFSDDLINWTHRQLLMQTSLPPVYEAGQPDPIAYPALIDPDSESRIFETTDQNAYLYYTQFNYSNGQMTLDRDLVRLPIEFDTLTVDAPEYEVTINGRVPGSATRAEVGYRINTECSCSGTADFSLYGVRYTEADNAVPVANSNFVQGITDWDTWGNASFGAIPSDLNAGNMLQVRAENGQIAAANSTRFDVSPRAEYTVTFTARIEPTTQNAGYFTIIFFDGPTESERESKRLRPNVEE